MRYTTRRLTFSFSAFVILQLVLLAAAVPAQSTDKDGSGSGIGPGRGAPSPAPVDDNDPNRKYSAREVTKKAVLTYKPEPNFTVEARKNDVTGTVRLRMLLGSDGKVSGISVVRGLPDGLTEEAIKAARAIRFTPAQKDGRNVSQWVVIEYNFNIYYDEDDPDITRKVAILEKPAPQYTEEARRKRTQGTVVLSVIFNRDGTVGSIEPVKRLPDGLTEQAVEAARAIRFRPAEASGRPVSIIRNVEYVFTLY